LNSTANTLVVGTFIVDLMENEPNLLTKNVFSSGMDGLSYHPIQDGLD
jgi:hypothetical protein